jgi:AraC-like DNA-binding protein
MKDCPAQDPYNFLVSDIGFVLERKPNPEWKITNLTNSDYYILAYATQGKAHYYFDGKDYAISKGDLILFSKGSPHSAASSPFDPWAFYSVAFDLVIIGSKDQEKLLSLANSVTDFNSFELSPLFSELNHIWTGKSPGYLIRCRSIIMQILYLMIREMDTRYHNVPHIHTIEEIQSTIQNEYYRNFSIEELTQKSGLSPSYFRQLFKQVTGYTPVQYQNQIKINKAKDLLLSGECNVSEAAENVGFDSIYYFSRVFKKITGVSPSDYLKR